MMKKLAVQVFKFLIVAASFSSTFGQSQSSPNVKWQAVIGREKEFVVFMPSGFKTTRDPSLRYYGSSSTGLATSKDAVVAYRLCNGTLLLMNYYEGNGSQLFKALSQADKTTPFPERKEGKYKIESFSGKVRNLYQRKQYFVDKDRLYVITALSHVERDPIAEAFFASVRLADGDTYLAPNAKSGDDSTALPRIKEVEVERFPDTTQFSESEVDRNAIVLSQPRFSISPETGTIPESVRISATAVLSSSGIVKDVKTSGSASLEMKRAFAETIKNIVFVPAEKDGKLVSVMKTFSYEMVVEVRREVRLIN